jgi:hypothetical protein
VLTYKVGSLYPILDREEGTTDVLEDGMHIKASRIPSNVLKLFNGI